MVIMTQPGNQLLIQPSLVPGQAVSNTRSSCGAYRDVWHGHRASPWTSASFWEWHLLVLVALSLLTKSTDSLLRVYLWHKWKTTDSFLDKRSIISSGPSESISPRCGRHGRIARPRGDSSVVTEGAEGGNNQQRTTNRKAEVIATANRSLVRLHLEPYQNHAQTQIKNNDHNHGDSD